MNHTTFVITGLAVGAALHVGNAAAGAMLPPEQGKERTRYGYWYRLVQKLASNSDRLEAALPALAREIAAEEERPHIIHRSQWREMDVRETHIPVPPGFSFTNSTQEHAMTPSETTAITNDPSGASASASTSTTTTTAKHSFFVTVVVAVAHLFVDVFKGIFSSDQSKQIEAGIVAFIKTDVGQLAVDAVQYASTLVGLGNDALRAAAVAKLKTDLAAAGKDLTLFGESALNLFIEMAFTYVQGTVAALPAAIA